MNMTSLKMRTRIGPERARSLNVGENIAVIHDSCWSRAQVAAVLPYGFTVWLIDYGNMIDVTVGNVYGLEESFRENNGFAMRCHVANLREDIGSGWLDAAADEMRNMAELYGPDVIISIKGDVAISTEENGFTRKSMPVDLIWFYEEAISPFEPNVKKTVNLLEKLTKLQFSFQPFGEVMKQGGTDQTKDELLDSLTEAIDLLNTSDNEMESTETVPQKEEQNDPGFHWPNPEIPSSPVFAARCTHVDNSGQIYLQLEANKSTMKSVHDELNRKHWGKGSSGGRLQERRECIARWSDNRWYRARVLSHGPFVGYSSDCDMVYVLFVDFGIATNILLIVTWSMFSLWTLGTPPSSRLRTSGATSPARTSQSMPFKSF